MCKSFVYCKKWLRKNFPSKLEYRVLLVSHDCIKGHLRAHDFEINSTSKYDGCFAGYVYDDKKTRYSILIHKEMCEQKQIEALLHEFAHLLQYHIPHAHKKLHGAEFQNIHKKIKRKWATVNVC